MRTFYAESATMMKRVSQFVLNWILPAAIILLLLYEAISRQIG